MNTLINHVSPQPDSSGSVGGGWGIGGAINKKYLRFGGGYVGYKNGREYVAWLPTLCPV